MPQHRSRRSHPSFVQHVWRWTRRAVVGAARLFTPNARGVYPPHSNSLIVLGVALPPDADVDLIRRRLWWRGLGVIERERHRIAGADVTAAVHQRRVRQARQFVIKQLRNAGVPGVVTRWDHASLGTKDEGRRTRDEQQGTSNKQASPKKRTPANNARRSNPKSKK